MSKRKNKAKKEDLNIMFQTRKKEEENIYKQAIEQVIQECINVKDIFIENECIEIKMNNVIVLYDYDDINIIENPKYEKNIRKVNNFMLDF
jgi:hypothetical protein